MSASQQYSVNQLYALATIPKSAASCVSQGACIQNIDGKTVFGGATMYTAATGGACSAQHAPLFAVNAVPYISDGGWNTATRTPAAYSMALSRA